MFDPRVLLIAIGILLFLPQRDEKPEAKLQGYDAITLPGEEVILKAKVERDEFLHRDLEDQKVVFRLEGEVVGTAITGSDGIARVAYRPEQPGTYRLAVALHPDARYRADEGEIYLVAIPKDRSLLVCDIDHTVADISALRFLITANEDVEPLPGALEALKELSDAYQIIYLTARDDAFMRKTKAWMRIKDLPRAPIFFWDFLGSSSLSRTRYKTEQVAGFKERWPNTRVGVGDKEGDAKAYRKNGLSAYILGDADDLPEGTIRVSSWKEILADLTEEAPEEGDPPEAPEEGPK